MLSTHAVCPDKKFFFKCLHHRLLGDRGQTLGTESTTVTTEWIGMEHTERVADNEIMRLWSFMYIPPVLHSFAGNGGNLTVTGVAELKGAGEIVNAEAFAVDGNHWYAVLSDETGEDGHLFVSKAGAGTKMSWLPSSHRVIAMNRAQTGFGLLYRIGDNPSKGGRMAMISLDGKRMGDPVKLKPGPLPAPFADEMTASLSVKKKTLWMTRQDAAGRKIGDPVQVGVGLRGNRDEAPYDVAWTGSGFVATYATIEGGQWRFYAVPITCSGPAR